MGLDTGRIRAVFGAALVGVLALQIPAVAQDRGRGAAPPPTPRQLAPIDLTGYWVSLVTEDWRYRMIAGAKGDFPGIPLNAEGRKAGMAWDPAKDQAAGEQCKPYGAAAIMRVPTRLRISWEGDAAMKVETDAGTQTRMFHFAAAPSAPIAPGWQGTSVASWDLVSGGKAGGMKVVTTNMRPGYLRWNGPPYSGNAVMVEFFDVVREPDGAEYLVVISIVEDPTYLNQALLSSAQFKKQADASGWNPSPCATP